MLKISKLKLHKKWATIIYSFVVIVSVLILRLPSFEKSVIDWDESTYLLVGDNILHGGLPYREIWDNKGALLYYIFAFIIKITGHSIIGLRLITTIWVAISSLLIFLIGKKLYDLTCGVLASLFFIISTSTDSLGGLASNAELFFILPVIVAVYIILFLKRDKKNLFLAGIFLGLAFNIKATSVFDFAAISFVMILTDMEKKARFLKSSSDFLSLLFGFLVPLFSIMIYFQSKGFLGGFLSTNFISNFLFVSYRLSLPSLIESAIKFVISLNREIFVLFPVLFTGIIGHILGLYERNERIRFLVIWLTFISLGIIIHHRFWLHMFIQALPATSLLFGFCFAKIFSSNTNKLTSIFLSFYLILGLILPVTVNILHVTKYILKEEQLKMDDKPVQVSDYLKGRMGQSDYLYVPNAFPILYFLTNAKIPTRYANPGIFKRASMYEKILGISVMEEVRKILNMKPLYIVLREDDTIISEEADGYLKKCLEENYLLENRMGDVAIFRYREYPSGR